ncbi:MAG: SpoIIE family protein phosphatase [Erysipelotrichaceae bacterium]
MSHQWIDTAIASINKKGEELCGDCAKFIHTDNASIAVLCDGLGSGVKANILATLSTQIILSLMANDISIQECVATMVETLPLCKERGLAYATFSILKIENSGKAYLAQFDAPDMVIIRNNHVVPYQKNKREILGKTIYESHFYVEADDCYVLFSDGALFAGMGNVLNFGWGHEQISQFLCKHIQPNMNAKTISHTLVQTCNDLYGQKPGDDTTALVARVRNKQQVNVFFGPPFDPSEDSSRIQDFLALEGSHVVSGGTTTQIFSRYLNATPSVILSSTNSKIPPYGKLAGVDLVCEGIITMNQVLAYSSQYFDDSLSDFPWLANDDGACMLTQMLFDASDIYFYVGRAINPAHQHPDLSLDLSIKLQIIRSLASNLTRMGKRVELTYF